LPHAPQFALSSERLAQVPEQSVVPGPQTHMPLLHVWLPGHMMPTHAFDTHAPWEQTESASHVPPSHAVSKQALFAQRWPAAHAVAHAPQ
jgi:hypothetical protein